jgi:hypothetical protein
VAYIEGFGGYFLVLEEGGTSGVEVLMFAAF